MKSGLSLRVLITMVLLALLLAWVDVGEIGRLIIDLQTVPLLISLLLVVGTIVLSAYKWKILLDARGFCLSLSTLSKVYFVGLYMNNFLPSSIGGDFVRIYQVGRKTGSLSEATASVILERLLATVGLALVAIVAILPNWQLMGRFSWIMVSFVLVGVLLGYIFVRPGILRPLSRLPWAWWQKALAKSKEVLQIIHFFKDAKKDLGRVIGYSILFQLMIVLINYYGLLALGVTSVSIWQCALVVPIISALSMLPVSINGLGIREASYALLFAPLGVTTSQAVTLSMLFFILVLVVSLVGGVFFIMDRGRKGYHG